MAVKSLRWSKDGQKIAIVFLGVSFDGRQVDLIDVLDVSQCTPLLPRLDEFPAGRFSMEGYDTQPRLQNFAWDGDRLFALFSFIRNDGFGDLWIYNTETHRADQIRHITNGCCYRDPQFSPDGRYLLFAYQDRSAAPNEYNQPLLHPIGHDRFRTDIRPDSAAGRFLRRPAFKTTTSFANG